MRTDTFSPGVSVVRRDIWFDKVWSAWPTRVLEDDGITTTTVIWPGAKGFAPSTWVAWLMTGDASVRGQALPRLVARSWNLSPWTWQSTIALRQVVADRWFAVTAFFDAESHDFNGWYIDFQRPPLYSPFSIDTRDL